MTYALALSSACDLYESGVDILTASMMFRLNHVEVLLEHYRRVREEE
jgi:hypothetical protein